MNTRIIGSLALASALLAATLPRNAEAKPAWARTPLASDPKEGAAPCDWLEFHALADKGSLKIAYRCAATVNFSLGAAYSIYIDADSERDTGYRGADDQFSIGADYLLQGATLYHYAGHYGDRAGTDWSWETVGAVTFDVKDEWADFTLTPEQLNAKGESVRIILVGDNQATDVGGNFTDEFPDGSMKKSSKGDSIKVNLKPSDR